MAKTVNSSATKLALITGASSGIGRALAFEFAAKGYGVILAGRDVAALETACANCRELGAPLAQSRIVDLSKPGEAAELLDSVKDLEISVLVNNAGYGIHGEFVNTDLESEQGLVELQIQTTLALTKGLLPGMIKRGEGGLLNIASVYSVSPVPRQVVYGACKAFLLSFAEGIAAEIAGTGVTITTVCPGVTQTEFRKRSGIREKNARSGATAEAIAHYSYKAFRAKKRVAVPGVLNRVFVRTCRTLPMAWVSGAVERVNRQRGLHE